MSVFFDVCMYSFTEFCILNVLIDDLFFVVFFDFFFSARKNSVSKVLGFSFVCGRRPRAKLNRRTERGRTTVVANMRFWSVDSNIWGLALPKPGSWPRT